VEIGENFKGRRQHDSGDAFKRIGVTNCKSGLILVINIEALENNNYPLADCPVIW